MPVSRQGGDACVLVWAGVVGRDAWVVSVSAWPLEGKQSPLGVPGWKIREQLALAPTPRSWGLQRKEATRKVSPHPGCSCKMNTYVNVGHVIYICE